jgi:hypothetical protein
VAAVQQVEDAIREYERPRKAGDPARDLGGR